MKRTEWMIAGGFVLVGLMCLSMAATGYTGFSMITAFVLCMVGMVFLVGVAVLAFWLFHLVRKGKSNCPTCGMSVRSDWSVCPYCGSPLPQ